LNIAEGDTPKELVVSRTKRAIPCNPWIPASAGMTARKIRDSAAGEIQIRLSRQLLIK
jgi:hypothetical protein